MNEIERKNGEEKPIPKWVKWGKFLLVVLTMVFLISFVVMAFIRKYM